MYEISLIDKIKILMNLIISSPLFLFCSALALFMLIMYMLFLKKNKKINKWIFISTWILLFIVLLFNYGSIIVVIIDNLLNSVFMALYFPSTTLYMIILILSNFFFIYSFISKTMEKKHRIVNFISCIIIDFMFIMIMDIFNKSNIDLYDQMSIYVNSNLSVLFQLSTGVFTSWILLNLLITAHCKLKKYDKKKAVALPEIIFEDI